MEVNKKTDGNKAVLEVIGTIDTQTSEILSEALLSLDYSELDLTIDFLNTKYITSAGLRVLLVARKKLSFDKMRIINVNRDIAEVFETTGFADLLNFSTVNEVKETAIDSDALNRSFKALLKEKIENGIAKPVFVFRDREYTWQDVDKASQIIADDLYKMGVKKGSHVGICSPNSINWIFAFFAVQKLGGIAVLVNYGLKPNEIVSLSRIGDITHLCYGAVPDVTDYNMYASAVITEGSVITNTYDIGVDIDFTKRFNEYDAIKDKFPEEFNGDDAGVVIFSSGSTGLPKAILSSPHNMLTCVVPMKQEFQVTSNDRNCAFLPFFHVFGFAAGISLGILCDYTSYIPENNRPSTLIDLIDKYKCTMFHSVPTMVLAMMRHKDFTPRRAASLRVSILGGAATTDAQLKEMQSYFPANHFSIIYGMSENAAISFTAYGDSVEHIVGTVGKPVNGVEVEIRDASGHSLPYGTSGEICVRSSTMAVCYYKLDIEKQPLDDKGWLATGDLGILTDDGYLKLVGRVKDLIIRGGENISPQEITDAVSLHPDIADVKVVGVPSEILGEEVAAAIILKDGAIFTEDEMKNFLADKLAKYKIPRYFVIFDKFPLLGSGKIDAIAIKKEIIKQLS